MNALELLLEASACGVHPQIADGRLSYDAPPGGLSAELRAELKSHKLDLVELISQPEMAARDLWGAAVGEGDHPVLHLFVRTYDETNAASRTICCDFPVSRRTRGSEASVAPCCLFQLGRAFGIRTAISKKLTFYKRMPMTKYHDQDLENSPALKALRRYVEDRRSKAPKSGAIVFEEHEKEIAHLVSAMGAEILADDLQRLDVDSEQVTVEGVEYRVALECEQTYFGQLGPMRVLRHLYRPRGGGRMICPLELRAGIVEGAWTPRAARLMALMVAEIPPSDVERLLGEIGGLVPSASSLDRLPKDFSERWEDNHLQ